MAKEKAEKQTEVKEVVKNEEPVVEAAEEMVKVYVPLDAKTKGPAQVFIGVNGRRFAAQRGKYVEMPACAAEVLERSIKADMETQEMIDKLEAEFMDAKI